MALPFMALLSILQYPDPRLHKVAAQVTTFDDRLVGLTQDMLETMGEANGIGLAATQVNVHQRVIVLDVSETRDQPVVVINPVVEWMSDERVKGDEGCLSVPGIYDGVERAASIRIRAQDVRGDVFVLPADGLLAVCLQHEMDHLMGKVFVEYLSPLKRNRIKTKMLKSQREGQQG
jgi:peptide deformylase